MLLKTTRLRSRRAARWVGAGICLLFLLLLIGASAPTILGSRFCWPTVLGYLTSDIEGRVSARSASLGWFSPTVIQEVRVEDLQGAELLQVEAVRSESTLWALLWNSQDLGVVHIEKPQLTVIARDDGSNLEDVLASFLAQSSPSQSVRAVFEFKDGSLRVVNAEHVPVAALNSIAATVTLPGDDPLQGSVQVRGCQVTVGAHTGSCAGHVEWKRGGSSPQWSLSTQIQGLDVSCLAPLWRRLGQEIQAEGVLTTALACQGQGPQGGFHIDVQQATLESLRLTAPAWLSTDQLQLQSLQLTGSCVVSAGRWQFTKAEVACDAGRCTVDGQFAWRPEAETSVWQQLLASVASADLQVKGHVDLARLTQSLPATLRIRAGAAIERGSLEFDLVGRQDAEQAGWSAQFATSELTAVCDGRRFTWKDPLSGRLEVAQGEQGWDVRQMHCHSSYLELQGQGTPQAGSVAMTCDLARLVAELRQLFDFGVMQAAGTLSTQLNWRRDGDQQLTLDATTTIDQFELSGEREFQWREPHLQATLSLQAHTDGQRLTRVDAGRFELTSAADQLDLQLLEPVPSLTSDTTWSVGGTARGEVSHWLQRVRPFLPGMIMEGSGAMTLEFTSRISPALWEVQRLVWKSAPLRLSSPQVSVDEPAVQVELAGRGDFSGRQAGISDAVLQSSALALRATDLAWSNSSTPRQLTGDISFRADLTRLHSTWQMPSWQQNWRAAGTAQGQVSLVQHEGSTKARWTVDLTAFELARRAGPAAPAGFNVIPAATTWTTIWSEPALKFAGSGQYDHARDVVQWDRFDLSASDTLRVSAAGSVAQPLAQCNIDVEGRVTYDLAKLLERGLPGSGVRVAGQDTQPFSLRGPLFRTSPGAIREVGSAADSAAGLVSPALTGLGGVRWQSADLFGIAVGPGQVSAQLAGGVIDSDVIETPLSQGTLRIAPRVHLNTESPLLTLDAGQVLTNVDISPAMCQEWLKYVAPLAADATRAEGRFSVDIERAAIPILQPAMCEVRGVLRIDAARLGPGPLAEQLMGLGRQIEAILQGRLPAAARQEPSTWVTVPQQQTHFDVAHGRVHHDRFAFHVDNAVLSTRGSVGFDQSLDLVVQVPVQDAWLESDKRLAVFRGMTVEVPISGTLARPRLDSQAVEQLTRQVLRQTASRLLEDGINRGLQQLLGPGNR